MKLLAFSDLHCDMGQAEKLVELSDEVDVVVGAGDYASIHKGLDETISALKSIDKPTVLVAGNNETDSALRAACEDWPVATVLHGNGAEINGINFFGLGGGIPTTPWDWSFDLTEEEADAILADCPQDGILVMHSPPKGYLDGPGDTHLGSEAILKAIEAKQPRIAVFGHIHECGGQKSNIGNTQVFNLGPEGTVIET